MYLVNKIQTSYNCKQTLKKWRFKSGKGQKTDVGVYVDVFGDMLTMLGLLLKRGGTVGSVQEE